MVLYEELISFVILLLYEIDERFIDKEKGIFTGSVIESFSTPYCVCSKPSVLENEIIPMGISFELKIDLL